METFPIIKRKDIEKFGNYRTKLMILKIYDAMQAEMAAGEPYQTILGPTTSAPLFAPSTS